ncbi:UNVERIFIED_CONTAM: hypothetical protein RMT77_009557 [Armadillidium vulgare]
MIVKNVVLIFLITILNNVISSPTNQIRPRRQAKFGITNFEINESVKRLDKNLRTLENKLSRHEFREAQVADFSTKTLNALTADHGLTQKNMQTVARQLGSMEERLLAFEALISTIDERQRKKIDALSDGINRLLMSQSKNDADLPPLPPPDFVSKPNPEIERDLKKVLRKVIVIDDNLKRQMKSVNNEVKIVGESLTQHMDKLTTRQDRLWNDWNVCQNEQISSISEASSSLSRTGALFVDQISEAKKLLTKGGSASDCNRLSNEVAEKLDSLDRVYQDQERKLEALNLDTHTALKEQKENLQMLIKETQSEKALLHNYFGNVYDNLKELDSKSKHHLGELETTLKNIIKENSQDIKKRADNIASVLNEKTSNILTALDDTAAMSENLQHSLTENFEDLTKDIRGLKKVEQVMLNTADAVLDTKRSIEFGIQQVILELSDTVKNSGKNIDSTLSDHINNISFAILKNQTSALTNMTQKMEDEISQVWRQIGIMYQQIAQSVDLLGELKSTTSQQMNASLDKVDNMDGTVGAINNKVADVEDNLNYLLGRLSLVVSEFAQMKTGVGSELEKLRAMAQEFSGDKIVEYQVHRKRSISDDGFNSNGESLQ